MRIRLMPVEEAIPKPAPKPVRHPRQKQHQTDTRVFPERNDYLMLFCTYEKQTRRHRVNWETGHTICRHCLSDGPDVPPDEEK